MGNFELRHEQERTTHSIKHAFLKQLILIVTLGLIAGSFQFCRFMQYPDAFIYYKPYANDTKIIKVKRFKRSYCKMNEKLIENMLFIFVTLHFINVIFTGNCAQ